MNASKPTVLILGGGVTGLAAARALDAYDVCVEVVEKQDHLGGNAMRWACMATDSCQFCGACLSAELADQVTRSAHATVHLNSTVDRLEKLGTGFKASLKGASETILQADAVLLATGMTPFDPTGDTDLGYSDFDQVITTAELNDIFQQDRLSELLPATPAPAIAFIQCVGSRNRQTGRDYCSQVCCKTAVRQVNKILHQVPQADITLFHMDLQVIGKAFRGQVQAMQSRVKLQQGVPAKIWNDRQPGKVSVIQEDAASGARTARHFDLIVLAVGILPSARTAGMMEQLGAGTDDWGFVRGGSSPVAGVYAAGAALAPTDIVSARQQGILAAHRMAMDLGWGRPIKETPRIAVIGGTREAAAAAENLADSGYAVSLLDNGGEGTSLAEGQVDYHPRARLRSVSGTLGAYRISFDADDNRRQVEAAAIVAAAGIHRQPAVSGTEHILSLSQFAAAHAGGDLKNTGTVVFWLDQHGPEWKAYSRQSLLLAVDLVSKGCRAIVIMEKMLVHGLKGQRIYNQARHMGVRVMRVNGADQVTVKTGDAGITLEISEATLPGVSIALDAGLLVIPDAVQPALSSGLISQHLRQSLDGEGFLQSANVRHRPVGSPRKGIFFIGSCHDEADDTDLRMEIEAVKASLHQLTRGRVALDPPAVIDEGKCGRCLTCYRACPHAAVMIKNAIQPVIVAEACVGCGICVSSCPAKAIGADPQAQLPSISSPDGATVVFACQRSGALAAKAAGIQGDNIRLIEVRCAGQLDEQTLLQPILEGAASVVVAACHEGNCRSMTGSRAAAVRAAKMTDQLGFDPAAVRHHFIAANEPARMARIVGDDGSKKEDVHA